MEGAQVKKPSRLRRLLTAVAVVVGVVLADGAVSTSLLWCNYHRVMRGLTTATWQWGPGHLSAQVEEARAEGGEPKAVAAAETWRSADGFQATLHYEDVDIQLAAGRETRVWLDKTGASFVGEPRSLSHTSAALREAAKEIPRPRWPQVVLGAVVAHPLITGIGRVEGELCLRIRHQFGAAAIGVDGLLRELSVRLPGEDRKWHLRVRRDRQPAPAPPSADRSEPVRAEEIDRSLAAGISLVALQARPVLKDPDTLRREGAGWLQVKDGHRVLHLEGDSYDLGYQHGRLLAKEAAQLGERVMYGVGLYYSLEKGKWFPVEARKLVERQRPFLDQEYFEELRGLAKGSGLPLAEVQAANIFPEFFHCSGLAVFGNATKSGEVLHARVLDYMTEVGLQDEAVVMAVKPTGRNAFVNVSYAGFIGSVTGMNEQKVAVGEMGGRGEGLWDGTPMSFLVRGVLEHCDTLEEALAYMRDHRRTCEYYYVVSDGKSRSAAGVAATPDRLLVVRPGQAIPQLPEAVPDAVLLSAGDRYTELVKRVREHHGQIDAAMVLEIIKRPVAMGSNLHNAVFAPERLTLWVNNASRNGPACNEPAAEYTWAQLFGER
jgi:hypothetical protein